MRSRSELLLLVACCGFLFFYGLGAFGLLGADEPRYAQVAREMLDRGDWITPTLNGQPWLEKPPLYYWQAMLAYRTARSFGSGNDGVTEQTARLPGAVDAAIMIAAIYFFLRRLRPGTELDAALITASCAGVIGFAHAASTDMPLTAAFTIALLAWYRWYESQRRINLAIFYLCLALGMLAKGPVAPALAAVIVLLFAAVKRDWAIVLRTLWVPGIALFLAIALPWYIAVQLRNPEFFRVFILEHNLARFSTNIYHHPQPVWFYLPVFLLAAMPWALWLIMAIVERARAILGKTLTERREEFANSGNSWPLFLILWLLVPILFFSAAQSKLPGYILPSVPPVALLVANYFADRRKQKAKISWPIAVTHGLLCGLLIFAALSAASIALNHHLAFNQGTEMAAAIAAVFAMGIVASLVTRSGSELIRATTMFAVIVSVTAAIRLASPTIDATQSSRPVAEIIQEFSHERVPVALYHLSRVQQYGLDFYLNRPTQQYEDAKVPSEAHILVAHPDTQPGLNALMPGRKVSYLTSIPAQKLALYWVGKE